MLIAARNAFMTRRLPYDAEVEYLESTGTQWINTGVSLFNPDVADWRIIITFSYDTSYNFNAVFATSSGTSNYESWIDSGNTFYVRIASIRMLGMTTSRNTQYCAEVSNTTTEGFYIKVDGVSKYTQSYIQPPSTTPGTITVGRRPGNGGYLKGRIYSVKLFMGSTLVYDGIPVRRGTVGYMYDRVTRRLFGNEGSGDFVLGPDVVPVEWLEFAGTQRLLTDILLNTYSSELKTSISYQLTSTASRQLSGSNGSYIEFCSNGGFVQGDGSYQADLNRHTLDFTGWTTDASLRVLYDGQNISANGFVKNTNTNYNFTFGSLSADSQSLSLKAKVYSLSMEYQDATKFLHWCPVRVGSGSTWEGAMMDVLTRRIYRNAGTGAFTYGNDLKYPIPAS